MVAALWRVYSLICGNSLAVVGARSSSDSVGGPGGSSASQFIGFRE
jgi:hypothetical protein